MVGNFENIYFFQITMTFSEKNQSPIILSPFKNQKFVTSSPSKVDKSIADDIIKRLNATKTTTQIEHPMNSRKVVTIPNLRNHTSNRGGYITPHSPGKISDFNTNNISDMNVEYSDAHNEILSDLDLNLSNIQDEQIILEETVVPYVDEEADESVAKLTGGNIEQPQITQSPYKLRNRLPEQYESLRLEESERQDYSSDQYQFEEEVTEVALPPKRKSTDRLDNEPALKKNRTDDPDFDMDEFFREENENSGDDLPLLRTKRREKINEHVKTSDSISSLLQTADEQLVVDSNVNKLAVKLVKLLRDTKEGVLDLKNITRALNVKNKRRIYDIVNVLTGIGLIEKELHSTVVIWKGGGPFSNSKPVKLKLAKMRNDNERLEKLERTLDQYRFYMEQSLKNLTDDLDSEKLMYVSQSDTAKCFPSNETVIAIESPIGTKVQCPVLPQYDDKTQFELRVVSKTQSTTVKLLRPFDHLKGVVPTSLSEGSSRVKGEFFALQHEKGLSECAVPVSPPPLQTDYRLSLDETEGLCDLYL